HPLPNGRLLTFGQSGTEEGALTGMGLKIFDVQGNTATLLHDLYLGDGYSEVSTNHKAFTFVQDHFGPDQSLLLFPMTSSDSVGNVTTGLQVAKVSAEQGITLLGLLDHTKMVRSACSSTASGMPSYCYYGYEAMRRGLMIGEEDGPTYVYSISYAGLAVHDLENLEKPLYATSLPQADSFYY
ncbi:MAG TPA: beta-propeller domain-containing protein, partial [Polyangiaceae bacterium]|nr:beta-propeller domain-containing protein [Polyangiaceae bacterium]